MPSYHHQIGELPAADRHGRLRDKFDPEVQLELKGSETKSFWWNSPAGKFLEGDKK